MRVTGQDEGGRRYHNFSRTVNIYFLSAYVVHEHAALFPIVHHYCVEGGCTSHELVRHELYDYSTETKKSFSEFSMGY